MILSLVMGLGGAWAQEEPAPAAETPVEVPAEASSGDSDDPIAPNEDPLSKYRTPFRVLTNRTIGQTSMPLAFDWRRTKVHLAATGGYLVELNTFNSARVGGRVRLPNRQVLIELGLDYVQVWDSVASRQLRLTQYRQPGRPSRLVIDANVSIPLAEGVVTAMPKFFPAVQLVFNANLGVRYAIYPVGFANLPFREVAAAIFSPTLSTGEIENLERVRLDAMVVDPARYGLTAGFTNDIYFERGIFVTPRVQFSLPLLAPIQESELPFWLEINLALGVAL